MPNKKSRKASKKVVDTKMVAANDKTHTPNLTPRLSPEKPTKQQVIAVFGQSG